MRRPFEILVYARGHFCFWSTETRLREALHRLFLLLLYLPDLHSVGVNDMPPQLMDGAIDRATAIGSYYIAAAGLLLTIAALIVTAIGFYFSMKHAAILKSVEVEQKKFENALELFRIISGVKDTLPDGSNATFLQIAAIESLVIYPEYRETYVYMRDWYKTRDNEPGRQMYAALVRLVDRIDGSRT